MIRRPAVLLLAALLAACPSGPAKRRPLVVDKPVRGGVLKALLSEDVDFLDPQRASEPAAVSLMHIMHRGLMSFPSSLEASAGEPVPDLAAAPPTMSADGRTYTFTVRTDVSFGPPASRALTSADVRAGIMRLIAPGTVSPYAPYFRIISGATDYSAHRRPTLTGISAPNPTTVVVKLDRPNNDLLSILALPAAAAVPAEIAARSTPANISPSGPYMLAPADGYVAEESIHLVRNPAWTAESDPVRGGYLDEIRITIGRTADQIQTALSRGNADLSLDEPPDLASPASNPLLQPRTHVVANGCLRYLWMNTRIKPFNDVHVRAAVASAVDRGPVLGAAGGEQAGIVTSWPLPRTVIGYVAPSEPPPSPDPQSARAALTRARLPSGFTTRLVVGDRPVDVAQGQAIVAALGAAGIVVRLQTMPIASLYVDGYELPSKKIPMGIATWCADWNGLGGRAMLTPLLDGRTIVSRGNNNYAQLKSPAMSRLFDAAAVAPPARAEEAWRAAAALVARLAPWVPLLDLSEASLTSSWVARFVASPAYPRGDLASISLRPDAVAPAPSGS
ncbi:MAG: ABC transporter substrate-binding protein [Actinomycetota bacterium]